MRVDEQGNHHYFNDKEIRNFWIEFPDWEKNNLFAPVIHYYEDDKTLEGEIYERIVMPLSNWTTLFEKEGIDPKSDVPDPDKGFHFTKTTLICRGGQYFDEDGFGDVEDGNEEDREARDDWHRGGEGEYSLTVGWYIVKTDDYIREDVEEYRTLEKQGVVSNLSEYLDYLRKKR